MTTTRARCPPAAHCRLPTADCRPVRLVVALALLAPLALGACSPSGEVAGAPPPTATASRARATPVPTAAGRPNPVPIEPPTGLLPERTLAFVSDRGGQIDLWLGEIDEAGQPVRTRRLTDDAAIESFPTWSPDGTTLAYVVEDERALRNLWLLDLRTGVHRQLTREAPPFGVRRAAWLRGGRALIYDIGKPFDRRPDLRVVTTDGETLAPLLPDDGSVVFDWSTDGATLVCAAGVPLGEPKLVVTDAVPGAGLHADPAAPVGFGAEIAPDGRYAVYSAPPLSDNQVAWVMELATGRKWSLNEQRTPPQPVLEYRRYDHDFAWAPDGRWLVYVHGVGGVTDGQGRLRTGAGAIPPPDPYYGLYVVGRDGNGRELLTWGSADAAPGWSPDGRWISYLSDARNDPAASDVWLIATDPAYHRQVNLTAGHGNNWSPAWMPLAPATRDGR